nr:transcriptional regulator ATRX homolog isoform X2 [Danaus plexippus plexippus]
MADTVPVSDVLSEAMEYLSKLGSNLRVRSENLKEKRLKKEKLKNSHALQKAASKVLLICELSKKSIENVESGVKKVLTQIVANQSNVSDGGKIASRKSSFVDSKVKYEYFDYKSRKLKIKQKINLDHYTSVKVLTKPMPMDIQEKYPVYHDCELYRNRKKQTCKSESNHKDSSETKELDSNIHVKGNSSNMELPKQDKENHSEHPEITRKLSNDGNKCIKDQPSKTKESKSTKTKRFKHIKVFNDSSDSETETQNKTENEVTSTQNSIECDTSHKEANNDIVNIENVSPTVAPDPSSTEQNEHEGSELHTNSPKTKENCDIESNATLKENENKQIESDVAEIQGTSVDSNISSNVNIENIPSPNDVISSKTDDQCSEGVAADKTNETKNVDSQSSIIKPFIKCVNINKLLKDDKKAFPTNNDKEDSLIENNMQKDDMSRKKSNNVTGCDRNQRKPLRAGKKYQSEHIAMENDDAEYWREKRSEVKKFEPKDFHINIMRLPEFTQDYLKSYGLKRVIQNGDTVFEFTKETEKNISKDVLNVKSSPLNESDSESEENLKNLAENLKNDLNKPNRDNGNPASNEVGGSQSNQCVGSIDNTESNNLEERSKTPDVIINKNDSTSVAQDEIKSSLLNDSTDDNSPNKKRKRRSNSVSPSSKRKHMMESIHAKKMLLTDSSSSDTEDEALTGALKQIRDYRLTGNSSGDKEKKDKNENEPSDSDSSSISLNKRKRSRSNSGENVKDKDMSESESKKTSSQTEDNCEDVSCSSSKKMGRSKSNEGSSSQNTDSQDTFDKDIDGLTNLKSLDKKHRRRESNSSAATQNTKKHTKMPKPCISDETFLKAESSSDNASVADSDGGYEAEELPAITLSGLNGDGVIHLAKDDLLEESDSSSSHVKSTQDGKKNESEDGNLKSKSRRKLAISSDSEAGSSRKKDRDVKLSDFEDSEDDSEPKKTKRKKKGSDSDASAASSADESKKKRRRIKNVDESDGSGSETENEGRNKHGRKNIRKVMSKNQLEEATKKAAKEEKERIARIAERQKLYNNLEFDESGKPDEVVLDKVVLDFDPETKEPLIEVDKGLVKKLKPHQANGIKFMWNACFESVKRIKKDKGSGCILAHCMGLGKTLQVVSLTHTLLTHSSLTGVNRVLVVCPLSTVLNWVNEFRIWLKHTENEYDVDVYELSRFKQNSERSYQLSSWFASGGVCVLGYEMFRNLSSDTNKKFKKKMMKSFQESLVDPGPDLVVCDEGHLLKNEKTSLSQAMNRVRTLRRIVLTGTPLQNNLKEYYCMVQFVKPNLLGKYNEYLNRFVNPITNGQYTDSTEHDIRVMKRRSHVLHKMLDGAVQRRDYGVLAPFLPPKHEYVLFITLTEVQIKLYQHYLDNYSRKPLAGKSSGFLFPDFQSLQRIWTHPLVLKYNSERYEIMQQKKREREEEDSEMSDFIDDDSTPDESSTEESSDSLSDMSDDSRKKSKKKKSGKKGKGKDSKVTRRGTRANPVEMEDEPAVLDSRDLKTENPTEWWMTLVSEDELDDMRHSHKLVLLFDILRQCEAIGDKLLVFSQSLYSLDLIEHFLGKVDDATQEARVDEKLNGHVGSWSPGIDYFRLDGSTSCENRSIWCKNFNREDNPRARLFLISTRAGGLGINLVAANRVVIFDVSWNPSHDVQSIFRVYRFGQKKPCYIYRFLAMGTMEEKIYERQVTKQAISKRVIDEQQIDRHYAENDLAELYKFEPNPPPREIPPLPKDRLFAEMLKEHEAQIYKYHEHDSLLENKEEETLTEEERKAAWEDFENEKTRPPPAPFNYNMHNGMMPGLFAQQQQLAYAALAAMLRKETPGINDSQIRDMQTLLYNSNPAIFGGYDYGLMQKMGEIYKYAQPGMMNPGMMNPGMVNPGGGMGVGGSSGLQYEPPWQRQQQMRMQQLMQQQNYYAGGLGSRDPVAMALQQQRAREMMLGERTRPRGRPPGRSAAGLAHATAHAAATPTDVVNLDSD